jgi:hypothetical protein
MSLTIGPIFLGLLITPLVTLIISKNARTFCRPLFHTLVATSLCVALLTYISFAGGISFMSSVGNATALAVLYAAYCFIASALAAIRDPTAKIVMLVLFNLPIPLIILASPLVGGHIEGNEVIYSEALQDQRRCIVRGNDVFHEGASYTYEANIYKQLGHAPFLEEAVPLASPDVQSQGDTPENACSKAKSLVKVDR